MWKEEWIFVEMQVSSVPLHFIPSIDDVTVFPPTLRPLQLRLIPPRHFTMQVRHPGPWRQDRIGSSSVTDTGLAPDRVS